MKMVLAMKMALLLAVATSASFLSVSVDPCTGCNEELSIGYQKCARDHGDPCKELNSKGLVSDAPGTKKDASCCKKKERHDRCLMCNSMDCKFKTCNFNRKYYSPREMTQNATKWTGRAYKEAATSAMYQPSALENEWVSSPHAGRICETAMWQVPWAKLWLRYSEAVFAPKRKPARAPTPEEEQVLSYFVDQQTGQKRYIEPLSGVARHPLALGAEGVHCSPDLYYYGLFDIRYLITENYCDGQRPKPQVKLFDLGCTVFTEPGKKGYLDEYNSGSGSGPSIPLFYSMFSDRCLEPDDIFAWEAKNMPGQSWWNGVPVDIRHKLRFYNTPVEELPLHHSIHGVTASDASFLRMLPLAVKQEDYVVVKVDIEGGPELEIVEAIAARPELAALVDELFFEYHFRFDDKEFGWAHWVVPGSTVDSAIGLLTRLRQAGVRAHFWI